MTVKIGWAHLQEHERWSMMSGVSMSPHLLFDPEKYYRAPTVKHGRWRFTNCPAFQQYNKNVYVLRCPVDLHLILGEGAMPGEWQLKCAPGHEMDMNGEAIFRLIEFASDPGGRVDYDKPHLQFRLAYAFFADQPVTIQQIPAFQEADNFPGITVPGEFDIHAWHRQINWAFEWHHTDKPLILKRGQPLCYVKFVVHNDPTEKVELVKLKVSEQVSNALLRTANTPSFMKNTFRLFEKARLLRPKKFITKDNIWKPGD
jgi:hypothetical protein